tara:strand:+ start:3073 stop:3309 length:237 start_codon:yes stop_codon:yes gene_type:complete
MTQRTDYNGWTNRETWLINLHYEPKDEQTLDWIKDELEIILERIGDLPYGSFFNDFIDLNKINWYELKNHVQENYEEE